MQRRTFIQHTTAASVGSLVLAEQANAAGQKGNATMPHYYELRAYETRNDLSPARLTGFIQNALLPALHKQGIKNVGVFQGQTGFARPGLLVVSEYASLAALQAAQEGLANDKDFEKALKEFEASGGLPYVRYEATLLRAFAGHPTMEIPAPLTDKDGKLQPRVFELRTYESPTTVSLKNKIEMFNQEEIKIFRDCGFAPIFFGETVAGARMPSLTYLVGFDTMEQRDKAWAKFIASPDFNRIKVKPGWTDPEAVSTIHAAFVRPLAFSAVK